MVLAADLIERVADGAEEVRIGRDDGPVHVELDDGVRLADGRDLALVVSGLHLALGDVGAELHDLVRLAVAAEDRIVGRLDPDFLAELADALVLGCLELAAVQGFPELPIGGAGLLLVGDENAVMLALDFLERVSDCAEEVGICRDDRSVHVELDDGLRLVERVELGLELVRFGREHQRVSWDEWDGMGARGGLSRLRVRRESMRTTARCRCARRIGRCTHARAAEKSDKRAGPMD